jgi:hypothetical protein
MGLQVTVAYTVLVGDISFIEIVVKMAYSPGGKMTGFCNLIKEGKFSAIYHRI